MNHPRPHAPLGAQAIDQYIYVFGGSDRNCGSVLEKYDTVTDTWTTCHSMACNRCDTGLVVLRLAQEPQDGERAELSCASLGFDVAQKN